MPRIVPRPPLSAIPPMTQAAMASSGRAVPPLGAMLPIREAARMPANAAVAPARPKASSFVLSTRTPVAVAACLLPPTA